MEKKVTVFGLRACSWCNSLKKELDELGIGYNFVDVDKNSKIADHLEYILQTENYPIVSVGNSSSISYVFRADTFEELGYRDLPDGFNRYAGNTLGELVNGVIEYLNK
jgi:glutaredoxin